MTRTVFFHACGGPEVLRIEDESVPAPGTGEIQVHIEAIGINRAEAAFRSGQYLEQPVFPSRLGYEAAGTVAALGPGVEGLAVGDAICIIPAFSMSRYGVYAERANVPAHAVRRRPAGLDAENGAALWMAALTAYGGLIEAGGLQRGGYVVITAPSSSVGLAAIQIANAIGAIPIALTTSRAKHAALLAAGARHVHTPEPGNFAATEAFVREATAGQEAQLVFDPIAGPGIENLASLLAPQGQLVIYGNLSGQGDATPFPFRHAVGKGLAVRGYLVFETIRDPARLQAAEGFIGQALANGAIHPVIDRCFALDEIAEAHRYLESNQQMGKVIVTTTPLPRQENPHARS